LRQGTLCGAEQDCPDHVYRCRECGYSQSEEMAECPVCRAGWKQIDVSHGPGCPKNLLNDALESNMGAVVRRCFRILNAKQIGLTITLADITEEEFQVIELIDAEKSQVNQEEDKDAKSFQELLLRKLSRR
jgi:RNA polymerase subunit RPABC4/transcription elongation factor Spt4